MNVTSIIGNLTKDPELRYSQEKGVAIASFSIAYNSPYGEKKVSFFKCKAFNKTAEFICQYFTKGKQIALVGHLQQDSWETDQGEKRSQVVIVADSVSFVGKKDPADSQPAANRHPSEDDENIPF